MYICLSLTSSQFPPFPAAKPLIAEPIVAVSTGFNSTKFPRTTGPDERSKPVERDRFQPVSRTRRNAKIKMGPWNSRKLQELPVIPCPRSPRSLQKLAALVWQIDRGKANPDFFVANDPFAANPDFNDILDHFETIEPESISFYHVENTQPGNNYITKALPLSGFVFRPAWLPRSKSSAELFGQF